MKGRYYTWKRIICIVLAVIFVFVDCKWNSYAKAPETGTLGTLNYGTIDDNLIIQGEGSWNSADGSTSLFAENNLAAVSINEGVTRIEDYSFSDCSSLETVFLPDSLIFIGEHAFDNCAVGLKFYGTAGTYAQTYANEKDIRFVYDNGTLGEDITWEIENQVLYISGTGVLNASIESNSVITSIFKEKDFTKAVIGEGITEIGECSFLVCTQMTEVILPSSLNSLGTSAFSRCENLQKITLPSNLSNIGATAFYGCTSLTSISIPEKVTAINASTFADCTNLTEIEIPSTVKTIADRAFTNHSNDLVIYGTYGTAAEEYAKDKGINFVDRDHSGTVPEDMAWEIRNKVLTITGTGILKAQDTTSSEVQSIFAGKDFTKVILSEGIEEIDEGSFAGCKAMSAIQFPTTLENIGDRAFEGCENLSISQFPLSIKSIGQYAFHDCDQLAEQLNLPENLQSIGEGAFLSCDSLENVVVPDSVTTLGDGAFSSCGNLKEIRLPENLTQIPASMFVACSSLETVQIPEKVTAIGPHAFTSCSALTTIALPSSVTQIGSLAFSGCAQLTEIHIPYSVTEIADDAFMNRSDDLTFYGKTGSDAETYANLKNIKFVDSDLNFTWEIIDGVLYINGTGTVNAALSSASGESSMFADKDFTKLVLNKGIQGIRDNSFKDCANLKDVEIPDSVTQIERGAFSNCADELTFYGSGLSLVTEYARANEYRSVCENADTGEYMTGEYLGISYNYNSGEESWSCIGGESNQKERVEVLEELGGKPVNRLEDGLTGFGSAIKELVLSDKIQEISLSALAIETLESIEVDENNANYETEDGVLFRKGGNELLRYPQAKGGDSYTVQDSVEKISGYAFQNCGNLQSIELPSTLTEIEEYSFSGCSSLTGIEIPSSVTSIGSSAFEGCTSLKEVKIPKEVVSIADNAFAEHSSDLTFYGKTGSYAETYADLKSIKFVDSDLGFTWEIIDGVLYINGTGTVNAALDSGETSMFANRAFTRLVLNKGIQEIGDNSFKGCTNLKDVEIPDSVTQIEGNAFSNCADELTFYGDGLSLVPEYARAHQFRFILVSADTGEYMTGEYLDISYNYNSGEESWSCVGGESNQKERVEVLEELGGKPVNGLEDGLIGFGSAIKEIVLSDKIQTIELSALAIETLESIEVNENNANYETEDGVLFLKGSSEMLRYPQAKGGDSYTVQDGVEKISGYAFQNCKNLKSIEIPASLEEIENGAFQGCVGLEQINVNTGNSNYSSEEGVLYSKENSQIQALITYPVNREGDTYVVPGTVISINEDAFRGAANLKSVEITSPLSSIGSHAFADCGSLENILLGRSVLTNNTLLEGEDFAGNSQANVYVYEDDTDAYNRLAGLGNRRKIYQAPEVMIKSNKKATIRETKVLSASVEGGQPEENSYSCKWFYQDADGEFILLNEQTLSENGASTTCELPSDTVTRQNANRKYYCVAGNRWMTITSSAIILDIQQGRQGITDYRYNFINAADSFGYKEGYTFPDGYFERIIPPKNYSLKKEEWCELNKVWNGSCYGMSVTSALFNEKDSLLKLSQYNKDATILEDLTLDNRYEEKKINVKELIELMHVSQYDEGVQTYLGWTAPPQDMQKLNDLEILWHICYALEPEYETDPEGMKLIKKLPLIFVSDLENGRLTGHILLGYYLDKISNTNWRIYVYDCNDLDSERYIDLDLTLEWNGTGWRPVFNRWSYDGVDKVRSSEISNSCISYVPYKIYSKYQGWVGEVTALSSVNKKAAKLKMNAIEGQQDTEQQDLKMEEPKTEVPMLDQACMLKLTAKDVEVLNEYGEKEIKFEGGELVNVQKDVIPFVYADEAVDVEKAKEIASYFYIPAGYHKFKKISNGEEVFAAKLIDEKLGVSVTTTAEEIEANVNDEQELQSVSVNAKEGDTYEIALEVSLDAENKAVKLTGVGTGETVSIVQKEDALVMQNLKGAILEVEGERKEYATVTATKTEGGSISQAEKTSVLKGESLLYGIKADSGYQIREVIVDGRSVGAVSEYEFQALSGEHTIHTIFEKIVVSRNEEAITGSTAGRSNSSSGGGGGYFVKTGDGKVDSDKVDNEKTNNEKMDVVSQDITVQQGTKIQISALGKKEGDSFSVGAGKGKLTYTVTKNNAGRNTVALKKIPQNATKVVIPAVIKDPDTGVSYKVTKIKKKAFQNRKALRTVVIGTNVVSIGKKAFFGCRNLSDITVYGRNLDKIGKKAFQDVQKGLLLKVEAKSEKQYRKIKAMLQQAGIQGAQYRYRIN